MSNQISNIAALERMAIYVFEEVEYLKDEELSISMSKAVERLHAILLTRQPKPALGNENTTDQ